MTKKAFLEAMRKQLSGLPKEERDDILLEYQVHFDEGLKSGRTEEQIVRELGSPAELARMYRADVLIRNAEDNVSTTNILRAILATLGLGLFNLILVLGPFVGLLGILIGVFAVSVAMVGSGVVMFVHAAFGPITAGWIHIPVVMNVTPMGTAFLGIGLFALGLLVFIFGVVASRAIYRLTIRYLRFNLKIVKGK